MGRLVVRPDDDTVAYFDEHTPEYGEARVEAVVEMMRPGAGPDRSLIDIGCGTGNTLEYIRRETNIGEIAGIDVSPSYLEMVRGRLGCETHLGSILDADLVTSIDRRYDYALLSAILHHLIGRTRAESRRYAALAIEHAARLLKPGGVLIVQEPVFQPYWAASLVFYVKKGVTRLTKKRVPLFGYWNNIGAPVVSYYTDEVLIELIDGAGLELTDRKGEPAVLPLLARPLLSKANTTVVASDRSTSSA